MDKVKLKKLILFLSIIVLIILCSSGWLIFHKPAYKGRVINTLTKEPIEGAVVVAQYFKHTLISGPGGGYSTIVNVKEVLTDKNGEFYFPPYMTIIQPNSYEDTTRFVIYKPGYGSLEDIGDGKNPPRGISIPTIERYFFSNTFGKKGEIRIERGKRMNEVEQVIFGLVELPPLKSEKERLRAIPGIYGDISSEELPLFFKAKNEERKRFGLKPVGRPKK